MIRKLIKISVFAFHSWDSPQTEISCTVIKISVFAFQSWDAFFRNASNGAAPGAAYVSPPSLASSVQVTAPSPAGQAVSYAVPNTKVIEDHLAVQAIIRSYQVSQTSEGEGNTLNLKHYAAAGEI